MGAGRVLEGVGRVLWGWGEYRLKINKIKLLGSKM